MLRGLAKSVGYDGALVPISDCRVVFLVVELPEVQIPVIDPVSGRKTMQPACAFFHNLQIGGISTDLMSIVSLVVNNQFQIFIFVMIFLF